MLCWLRCVVPPTEDCEVPTTPAPQPGDLEEDGEQNIPQNIPQRGQQQQQKQYNQQQQQQYNQPQQQPQQQQQQQYNQQQQQPNLPQGAFPVPQQARNTRPRNWIHRPLASLQDWLFYTNVYT